eukprot:1185768-Prorocentrum_minimum.AAC.3
MLSRTLLERSAEDRLHRGGGGLLHRGGGGLLHRGGGGLLHRGGGGLLGILRHLVPVLEVPDGSGIPASGLLLGSCHQRPRRQGAHLEVRTDDEALVWLF